MNIYWALGIIGVIVCGAILFGCLLPDIKGISGCYTPEKNKLPQGWPDMAFPPHGQEMTAYMNECGTLVIEAKTAIGKYALKCWAKQNECTAAGAKLEIRTGVDGRDKNNGGYEA